MYVEEWPGPAARTFVCVAGLAGSHRDWRAVGPDLATRGRVLAPDLPGTGRTARAGRACDVWSSSLLVDGLLERCAGEVVLVGHSLGAVVALLAAACSSRPARLVLTSPFVPVSRNGRSTVRTAVDYAHHRALYVRDAARRRRRLTADEIAAATDGLRSLTHFGLRPLRFDAVAARVDCPVLVVHGDQDHHVPVEFVRGAAIRHPAWTLRIIAGVGHEIQLHHPDVWIEAVAGWLDASPGSPGWRAARTLARERDRSTS